MSRKSCLRLGSLVVAGSLILAGVGSLFHGCSYCSPTVDEPISGEYRVADHEITAPADLVGLMEDNRLVLTYTGADGATYRVTYEIGEKVY